MDLLNKQTTSAPSFSHASQSELPHAMLAGKICLLTEVASNSGSLIDSGVTNHICSYLSFFDTYKPVAGSNENIIVPEGRQIPILHTGSVHVHDNMVLHNVLHIPDFHYNLISVQRLCKDMNCSIKFDGNACVLQDLLQKEKPILLGKVHGGLYNTSVTTQQAISRTSFLSIKEDPSVWHLRLGHMPFNKMKLIPALSKLQFSLHQKLIC